MTLTLHQHPFAAFCWKALIAAYELDLEFTSHQIDTAEDWAEHARLWPMSKIPVLEDSETGLMLPESTAVVEYLDGLTHSHLLISSDPAAALQARLWDRFFDGFVAAPMQKIVLDHLRPDGQGDAYGVDEARGTLRTAYGVLESQLGSVGWAAGESFSLADCSAAPALHYALAVEPWDRHEAPNLSRYYAQLAARPSVKRVIDEARPYRSFFPPGWPAHME